jgi:hypothetical protein
MCKPGFDNPKGPTHLKCSSLGPKFTSFDFSKFQCKAAETCSAAENQQQGSWADPKTWRGYGVPSSLDAVHISDKPVNVQKDAEAQGLVIEGSMASLFVLDGSVTVGEDDPACSKELCNIADLVVGSGLTKKLYGRMLFEGKRGLLTLVNPSSAKSAVIKCDIMQGYVPSGVLDAEVVMCSKPDSFKKFKPSIKCKKEAQTTCSATTASKDSGSWNAAKTWKDGKVPVSVDQVVLSTGTNIAVNKASKSDSIEISGYKQTQLYVNANLVIGANAGTCGTSTCDLKELKLSSGLEAKVFGGFVRNVKANLFMPATRKSAKAAIVRCAHGWKTSAAISSQIVVCDGPDAFKKNSKPILHANT